PSDRVQNNKIGACLMAEPDLVAECIHSMQKAVNIPVTVKHRIGIDDMQSYEEMLHFVDTVAATGCTHFVVHARIAILKGLSPKENREVPPLRYEDVYRLKQERPHLTIEINGGIKTFAETQAHLQHVDGVMIGREAYHNPYLLAELGQLWNLEAPDRFDIMEQMLPYIEQRMAEGAPLSIITRHILGLFQNLPGARKWRQALSGGNAKTLTDVENAIRNMQAAIIRTEEYVKEHQA
ncbi:tRNA dihydrouridine(20/20a) synthase DusA, partial [Acinetobacter baumannii]